MIVEECMLTSYGEVLFLLHAWKMEALTGASNLLRVDS